ncbi:hypothetical protein O6H91_12G093100 [Diphasiastrum complanatum]|uniref:Uncharacterized protein n=1 Tax=Diphasiastrum complanatum TaxID=34168 RepID=A0ACC2C4S0_DIPCM|nr:hypothetical protein O6H91_12G093100 [Diphasiastrum complanatum]
MAVLREICSCCNLSNLMFCGFILVRIPFSPSFPLPPLLPPLLQITIICVFNHPCRSSAFKKEKLNHRIRFFSFNPLFLRRFAAFVSAFGFIFLSNWDGAPTGGISRRSETNPR